MERKNSWYENDEFWEIMAPFFFSEKRMEATSTEVDHIVGLLGVKAQAALLDLCCGVGRHSLELARRTFRVTGVDRTFLYLETARAQAEREGLTVEFVQEDMKDFCRPEAFDGALMMFTSFGYYREPDDNFEVLSHVYSSLKKGGKFLVDVMGKEVIARIFCERDWREHNGVISLEERRPSENWTKMENRWIIIDGKTQKEFRFSHWVYSASELSTLLMKSGFSSVKVFGALEGALYDHTARRLVAVAQK